MLNLLATLVFSALPASPAAAATCPDPTPATADVAFGECGEAAPLDLWYRMSRFAESDPGGVGGGPARRLQANRSVNLAGVIASDDLDMRAIAGHMGVDHAAIADSCGCDVPLLCRNEQTSPSRKRR